MKENIRFIHLAECDYPIFAKSWIISTATTECETLFDNSEVFYLLDPEESHSVFLKYNNDSRVLFERNAVHDWLVTKLNGKKLVFLDARHQYTLLEDILLKISGVSIHDFVSGVMDLSLWAIESGREKLLESYYDHLSISQSEPDRILYYIASLYSQLSLKKDKKVTVYPKSKD